MNPDNKPIISKKSPVIIIRNLLILQFIVIGFYFLAGILANYGEIYEKFTLLQGISYEIAKTLLITIGESFLIALIFIRWFFTTYSIYPEIIIIEWGILFKKRKTIPLEKPISVSCHFSPLARIFRYGNIIIKSHYDERVALIFGQRPYGDDAPSRFYMEVRLRIWRLAIRFSKGRLLKIFGSNQIDLNLNQK